jgi:hypothetical protein
MGIKVIVKNAVEAMDLKAEVQEIHGLNHFRWRYTPPVNDWFGAEIVTPATVEFDFDDPKWETYFQLKWAV